MPSSTTELLLPDVNVLVALALPDHVHHEAAHRWLVTSSRFATTPVTEAGLVRLLLNPAVGGPGLVGADALRTLGSIRTHAHAEFLPDDSSLAEAAVDTASLQGHRQVTDLHLVNLAARHGARLVTFDRKLRATLAPEDEANLVTLS